MELFHKIAMTVGAALIWWLWNYVWVRWWGYTSILEYKHWNDLSPRDLINAIIDTFILVAVLIWIWT